MKVGGAYILCTFNLNWFMLQNLFIQQGWFGIKVYPMKQFNRYVIKPMYYEECSLLHNPKEVKQIQQCLPNVQDKIEHIASLLNELTVFCNLSVQRM